MSDQPTTSWFTNKRIPRPILVLFVAMLGACSGAETGTADVETGTADAEPGPADVVQSFVDAYNANDIDAVVALFAEDAVLRGHPSGPPEAEGETIRNVFAASLGESASEEPYQVSNVQVENNTVTWDFVFTDSNGVEYCTDGHSAVIEGGKVVSWDFADPQRCP